MGTSEDEKPWRRIEREELEYDLGSLTRNQLRQKYHREALRHANMKQRCKDGAFELAPEWEDFPTYLRDMGPLPDPRWTTDRIDWACRIYGPGRCRWAPKRTQTENRRNTRWLDFEGRRLTIKRFAAELGVPYTTVHAAVGRGETPEFIAERVRRRQNRSAWAPPEAVPAEAFWKAYDRWQGALAGEFRFLGSPEVFYLLTWLERYEAAQEILREAGLDELPAEAEEEANQILDSEAGRVWRDSQREIALTLEYIRERDPDLAKRLTPQNGQHFRSLTQLRRRAIRPQPKSNSE